MEKEIHISASWSKYSKEWQYWIRGYEPGAGEVKLETRVVQFESPADRELKLRLIEVLRSDLQKLRGEHYVEEKEKEEEIQELLALEDKSQEPVLNESQELPVAEAEDDLPF